MRYTKGPSGCEVLRRSMSIAVTVGLLSGKAAIVQVGVDEKVGALQCQAQTVLGVGNGRLLDSSGNILDGAVTAVPCRMS